ncbi:LAS superfamily LD-carboxypeptidase LdcB [Orenia metallireducens]|jgi:LAS superfamily LD-carboxypeptidase LdcB|uniref:LD-carboxypeptidase LdcB, LAS superfamily n=1 Tax=Orenia metallireducens TaxID=1413210 RepID=A0A285HP69_9FIRM|nr:D-alanyl-D-alanine carboxypeptidase family protein [Orenia metallireducens]PRX27973.1 LAS superfamily LD-carboxypeptidase LdcB [Orenia metallireducens]SNY37528.1 LD-carboxypeptidase LdcB, LAS superfamily [Orenia metallireducens]
MELFIGHKLLKRKDGYTVILYLDQELSEFAKDFDEIDSKERIGLERAIRDYIKEKLPNIKVKSINLMVGSLLVASLPFANIGVAKAAEPSQTQTQSLRTYKVESGDTLVKISNKFGTTVSKLKALNGLSSDLIYIGQTLKIPQLQDKTHIVQAGDTLSELARRYNLSLQGLKRTNGLTGDRIYIGQALTIPKQDELPSVKRLPDEVFRVGDRGEGVKAIQIALNDLGYSLVEDGAYGPTTERIVSDFQKQYDALNVDGIYGPKTKEYLAEALLTDHIVLAEPSDTLALVNKNNSLPSNYIPENLVVPDVPFPFTEFHEKKLMREDAARALERLFAKAKEENIALYATSGYRSYDRQKAIFTSKSMRYGLERANQFSAKPGESEHQTGLAMDVTSPKVNFALSQSFGETREGRWLKENAPKFGFIIRYPEGKEEVTGYQYEPWHLRYLGNNHIAYTIASNGATLEEYLGMA